MNAVMNVVLFEGLVKLFLVVVVVSTAFILTGKDLLALFRTYALQSVFIAAVAFILFLQERNMILLYTAMLTLVSKGIIIPKLLQKVQKSMNVRRDIEFHYLQPSGSIFLSIILLLVVHLIFLKIMRDVTTSSLFHTGLVVGVSLTFIGMLIIFSRRKIISKIVGYLTMENGAVLFSLFMGELPLLIEVLVLMDLMVLVLVAAMLAFGMDSSIEDFHYKLNPFRRWFKGGKEV